MKPWIYFGYFGRTSYTRDRPVARPLPKQESTKIKMPTYIHASSWIQSHNLSLRAVNDRKRHRPCRHLAQLKCTSCINYFTHHLEVGVCLNQSKISALFHENLTADPIVWDVTRTKPMTLPWNEGSWNQFDI